ncbi:hypothetical protein QUF64_01590 [Anaerolineales bacterium HSG6]|nr:hypothetical protein [Anaerolineales bacterium HSG6]
MLYQLLAQIRKRPALYINRKSVLSLELFLLGFFTAQTAYKVPVDPDTQAFAEFQDWLVKQYNDHSNRSWAEIIHTQVNDEIQGFDLFFTLLDQYKMECDTTNNQKRAPQATEPVVQLMEFA